MATNNVGQQLERIENAKADIQSTIIAKGVTVPAGTLLSDTAAYIAAIPNTTYKISKSGTTITLTGSDGSTSSVTGNGLDKTGTVTSVKIAAGTGLKVDSTSAITSSGTRTISIDDSVTFIIFGGDAAGNFNYS